MTTLTTIVLAARIGTTVNTPDGPLTKAHGGWSIEAEARANAIAEPGTPEWRSAIGPHIRATLTADGRGARTDAWCPCTPERPMETWVRYERWTDQGRVGHGYVCPVCRCVTQTG